MEALFTFILLSRSDPYEDVPKSFGEYLFGWALIIVLCICFFIYLKFLNFKDKIFNNNSSPIINNDKPKYQEVKEIRVEDYFEPEYPPIPDFQDFINERDGELTEPLKSNPIIIENRVMENQPYGYYLDLYLKNKSNELEFTYDEQKTFDVNMVRTHYEKIQENKDNGLKQFNGIHLFAYAESKNRIEKREAIKANFSAKTHLHNLEKMVKSIS